MVQFSKEELEAVAKARKAVLVFVVQQGEKDGTHVVSKNLNPVETMGLLLMASFVVDRSLGHRTPPPIVKLDDAKSPGREESAP